MFSLKVQGHILNEILRIYSCSSTTHELFERNINIFGQRDLTRRVKEKLSGDLTGGLDPSKSKISSSSFNTKLTKMESWIGKFARLIPVSLEMKVNLIFFTYYFVHLQVFLRITLRPIMHLSG